MLTEERKQELMTAYGEYMERYLDKQWIDVEVAENTAENEEELNFLRKNTAYSVIVEYK